MGEPKKVSSEYGHGMLFEIFSELIKFLIKCIFTFTFWFVLYFVSKCE